ncbi:MAG: MBL fold metallo-hydrolase [Vicinamibacterales bacterium]
MNLLEPGISYIDLDFQGLPRIIATAVLGGRGTLALVDPGPSTTLPTLERGLASAGFSLGDVTAVLLTHIHLDHAGVTGTLVRMHPHIKVYVHHVGAPHLADPSKLLASATRLYGDAMEQLWAEVEPVPTAAIVEVGSGDRIDAGGRTWDVASTPGHASHHVSYFAPDAGVAFVGDTAGVQIAPGAYIVPPTPPPDINLPLWYASLDTIEAWTPRTLFMTHFGPTEDVSGHLASLRRNLRDVETLARDAIAEVGTGEAGEARFVAALERAIADDAAPADRWAYEQAGRFDLNWRGLVRYLTKPPRVVG